MSRSQEELARLRTRLDPPDVDSAAEIDGVHTLVAPKTFEPAAVLAPVVVRPEGLSMIFTVRAQHLRRHAGQISFPGGRRDPSDVDLEAAAKREAHEEIGLEPHAVEVLGRFEPLRIGSGYRITPFVGLVHPAFEPRPDPGEVAETFEAPLAFLMDRANHRRREVEWRGARRSMTEIVYDGYCIWGATAGLLEALQGRLER